ncbi:FtsX-like permease family protein [Candidatus Fokinia crypta]|uniref:Lipoprotein-releasing transmembrane protein LolC n=1 Tax=Candidatus Fokinia crypta TaxID=1920990 RepID=A0ABZ0URH0_9RICK|nr:FtsX-like permease family protein [Candidatus Fokinia cryptica]WPX97846.1 Putative lipoprotein-releasing transmembrane protein LolC [Candidatus Fokinia cryptica]
MMIEFAIARRFALSRQNRAFMYIINAFAIAGIAIGVATLIIVTSVMYGYKSYIVTKMLGVQSHILVYPYEGTMICDEHDVEKVKNIKDVEHVSCVIQGQAMITYNKNIDGVLIKGIDNDALDYSFTKGGFIRGNITTHKHDDNAFFIVGNGIMKSALRDGTLKVKLTIPQFVETFLGIIPRSKSYQINDYFDSGMMDYNNGMIFMSIEDCRKLFGYPEKAVTGIEIMVQNPLDMSSIKAELDILFKDRYAIIDWKKRNGHLIVALDAERTTMYIILSIIIVVATFNIFSGLMVMVQDKRKEIAILRTIGMSKLSIMSIFLLCSIYIGVVGTILGVVFGCIFAKNLPLIRYMVEELFDISLFDPKIYILTELPIELSLSSIVLIATFSIICSLFASLYPSLSIAKISPSTVLKDG